MKKVITKNYQFTMNEDIKSDCRSIIFIKPTGSADCSINGFPLVDNQPWGASNYPGEIETTIFKIVFSGAAAKMLFVFKQSEV